MDDKKLAFIFGSNRESAGIYDGDIRILGNINDDDVHVTCLLDFANSNYPDVPIFKKLNSRHLPESVAYFYVKLFNHAVFFNTTKYNSDGLISKHGKQGLFLLPNKLSDLQKQSISSFLDEISDYSVTIFYNVKIEDGIFGGLEIASITRENPQIIFEKYLDKTNQSKSKSL